MNSIFFIRRSEIPAYVGETDCLTTQTFENRPRLLGGNGVVSIKQIFGVRAQHSMTALSTTPAAVRFVVFHFGIHRIMALTKAG